MALFKATNLLVSTFSSSTVLFKPALNWTLFPHECWAVFGSKSSLFLSSTLLGRSRAIPASGRVWPQYPAPERAIRRVTFGTRLSEKGPTSGEFIDYTARYGALLEEDKQTLIEHLIESSKEEELDLSRADIVARAKEVRLDHLLDMPLIALSNGQTRRARILKALLSRPQLLILEEPFTGLDVQNRALIEETLQEHHSKSDPQLVFTLRAQDHIPKCVTHVIQLQDDEIKYVGPRSGWQPPPVAKTHLAPNKDVLQTRERKPLITLKNVNIRGRTPILHDINWTISQGDRWLLRGPNGSGKSTMLCLITGDHPQSFVEDITLFGKARTKLATVTLQSHIGHVAPEIYNAFPRKHTPGAMTAYDAIASGFENVFTYRPVTLEQAGRIEDLILNHFADVLTSSDLESQDLVKTLKTKLFAELTAEQQAVILFMRAVVKQPDLLILDEPFQGMSERSIQLCRTFIDNHLDPNQALILVTHFEEEKPETVTRLLQLDGGHIVKRV